MAPMLSTWHHFLQCSVLPMPSFDEFLWLNIAKVPQFFCFFFKSMFRNCFSSHQNLFFLCKLIVGQCKNSCSSGCLFCAYKGRDLQCTCILVPCPDALKQLSDRKVSCHLPGTVLLCVCMCISSYSVCIFSFWHCSMPWLLSHLAYFCFFCN